MHKRVGVSQAGGFNPGCILESSGELVNQPQGQGPSSPDQLS